MSSESQIQGPPRRVARALIRNLLTGTPIMEGVRYMHIGHTRWLEAQAELLRELAEDHDSDVLFVRGTYGAGKTHFLVCVQEKAREAGWATSHVECQRDRVELDRFETVYPRVIYKIRSRLMLDEAAERGVDSAEIDGCRWFLDRWVGRILGEAGYSEGPVRRTMETEQRLYTLLQSRVMQRNLPGNLQTALCAYAQAALSGNADLRHELVGWFRGEPRHVRIPGTLLQQPAATGRGPRLAQAIPWVSLPRISRAVGLEVLRGILWVVRQTGHHGLVLCIDEVEEIAKLRPRKRQDQCFQTLREFVDNSDGELGQRYLCTYFAATPEMFDSEDYFRRYDALATRIEPVGGDVNWRSPVIDLDRTPLSDVELRAIAHRIRDIHGIAHDWEPRKAITDRALAGLLRAVSGARYRVAKPRLLCRVVAHELERARLAGFRYSAPVSEEDTARLVAERLQHERDA